MLALFIGTAIGDDGSGSVAGPVAHIYLDCLRDFEGYAESIWHDAVEPPESGFFGDGRSAGNGGIRGSCGVCVAYATLVRADAPGDQERRLSRLEAALRYAAMTHVTGSARCMDGKTWGSTWQSALWAGSLGFATALVEDRIDPEVVAAVRQVVAAEADRLAGIPPATGFRGDSKAEENAWNSNAPSLAAAWMHDDARAAEWLATARRYLVNAYTVESDASGPLAPWVTTVTLHPSFACENHGFFHPTYQLVSGMSLGDSWVMARLTRPDVARAIEPFAEHNVMPVWNCLTPFLLDSGELAYPAGLDWALHGYGQISYLAWIARHFEDPVATWAEGRVARLMALRQKLNGDGRFTGDSVPDGFYREAVMARRVAFSYWHHRLAERPPVAGTPPADCVMHLPDVGLLVQRSPSGFASLSYGMRTMGLVIPESLTHPDAPFVVTPRVPGVFGPGSLGAEPKGRLLSSSIEQDGFDAVLEIDCGPLESRDARVASYGDAIAVIEAPHLAFRIDGSEQEVSPLGIENHELTGGSRVVASREGTARVDAFSGTVLELRGGWACIDDRYGIVAGPDVVLRYEAARGYNRRGAAEDTVRSVPIDPAAPRYLILLPGASADAARDVAATVQWRLGDGETELEFDAPRSGRHRLQIAAPASKAPMRRRVPVQAVAAGSASESYPADRACDGNAATFWVSRRDGAEPGNGPTPEHPEWLEFRFAASEEIREVVILPRTHYGPKSVRLELGGKEHYAGTMQDGPLKVVLDTPTVCRTARLIMTDSFDPAHPANPRNVQVAEVLFLTGVLRAEP